MPIESMTETTEMMPATQTPSSATAKTLAAINRLILSEKDKLSEKKYTCEATLKGIKNVETGMIENSINVYFEKPTGKLDLPPDATLFKDTNIKKIPHDTILPEGTKIEIDRNYAGEPYVPFKCIDKSGQEVSGWLHHSNFETSDAVYNKNVALKEQRKRSEEAIKVTLFSP